MARIIYGLSAGMCSAIAATPFVVLRPRTGPSGATNSLAQVPSGRVRGFMSLPMELVVLIAQHLLDMGRIGDLAFFARLLSLEGRYTRALQEVLFSGIHLDDYERYASLTRTLQSDDVPQHSRQLALMVRSVSATLNAQPSPGQEPFLAKHLLNLYDQCPKLTHITLAGMGGSPHEHSTQMVRDIYPIEQLVTIQSLTLHCPIDPVGLALLCLLPHLRELRLVGGPVSFQLSDRSPLSGPNLGQVTWGSSTSPDALSIMWLCARSAGVAVGEITLLTRPSTERELEQIRDYALRRGMNFRSPPPGPVGGEI